jgi:DNA-directed RNA polymerase specialized sigma24 family protein
MTEEQRKEICKAYVKGFAFVQIADFEGISDEEVKEAVNWGKQTGYLEELREENETC